MDEYFQNIEKTFRAYGFFYDTATILSFAQFLEIFLKKNALLNLSWLKEVPDIIEKHFLDSLMITKFMQLQGTIADIGTGGGFPWIPLAIVNRQASFVLIDSIHKKIMCIKEFLQTLWLTHAHALQGRAEVLGRQKEYRNSFDIVVFRAVAYLPILLEYGIPLLKVWGSLVAYKIPSEEEKEDGKKICALLWAQWHDEIYYMLAWQYRACYIVRKVYDTPSIYPRNYKTICLKPLYK